MNAARRCAGVLVAGEEVAQLARNASSANVGDRKRVVSLNRRGHVVARDARDRGATTAGGRGSGATLLLSPIEAPGGG